MIDLMIPKVSRADAIAIGKEYKLSAFASIALAHKDHRMVLELLERAVERYPADFEARCLYVRRHARAM